MAKKKAKRSEFADDIMEGLREIQSWLDKGWGLAEIKQDLRENHPERIREPLVVPDPGKYPPAKVKAMRVPLGLRQPDFARLPEILVQSWKRGAREPQPSQFEDHRELNVFVGIESHQSAP